MGDEDEDLTPGEGWVIIEGGHYLLIPYGAERDEIGVLWSEALPPVRRRLPVPSMSQVVRWGKGCISGGRTAEIAVGQWESCTSWAVGSSSVPGVVASTCLADAIATKMLASSRSIGGSTEVHLVTHYRSGKISDVNNIDPSMGQLLRPCCRG